VALDANFGGADQQVTTIVPNKIFFTIKLFSRRVVASRRENFIPKCDLRVTCDDNKTAKIPARAQKLHHSDFIASGNYAIRL